MNPNDPGQLGQQPLHSQAQPQPQQYAQQERPTATQRSTTAKVVLISTAVVGGMVLIGAAASAMFGLRFEGPVSAYNEVTEVEPYNSGMSGDTEWLAEDTSSGSTATFYTDATDISSIDIELSFASLTVEFGEDQSEGEDRAMLEVHSKGDSDTLVDRWTMNREGAELSVERAGEPGTTFAARTKGDTATLTLPYALKAGIQSGSIAVNAGEFRGEGSFGELDIELNAGTVEFNGSAKRLEVEGNLGEIDLTVDGAIEADVNVNKGAGSLVLTGKAPQLVDLEAAMGSLDVQLPSGKYRVEADHTLGEFVNELSVDKSSKNLVRVEATAAELRIR